MVKRQKDKQYLSTREHRRLQGSRSGSSSIVSGTTSTTTRRLPFDCCALTLTPFTDPVCTPDGVIFESSAIVPYLMKHGADPVTGAKMTSRDLIRLNMDKDGDGRWQCPLLCKPFGDRTRVVAVVQRPPGDEANVYSYEAVQELNFKTKNYEDLTSGKKFHKARDVITLQDADDAEHCRLRDIDNFRHMADRRSDRAAGKGGGGVGDVRHSATAGRVMDALKRKREEEAAAREEKLRAEARGEEADDRKGGDGTTAKRRKIYAADLLGVELTTGRASSSLTSTAMAAVGRGENDMREATEEEILQSKFQAMKKLKKKGFVRLRTNMGVIDLEVHCDIVPQTAANFLGLAESGAYDGSAFHRSIRNFMIQGGRPPSKSQKDECLWGGSFPDEFDDRLTHAGPGVLSMANAGPGTNRRQFFLTYKSCEHLNRKHSVFGRVVAGIDVLRAMEGVPTDAKDRPREEIKILRAEVMGSNPVGEAEEYERSRIEERAEARRAEKEGRRASALGRDRKSPSTSGDGRSGLSKPSEGRGESASGPSAVRVGRYLPKGALRSIDEPQGGETVAGSDSKRRTRKDAGGGGGTDGDGGDAPPCPAAPTSRLPAAPRQTVFADFSGW